MSDPGDNSGNGGSLGAQNWNGGELTNSDLGDYLNSGGC